MDKLKALLSDIVDCYKRYFARTYGVALAFTTLCFIAVTLLLKYSSFDETVVRRQLSLVSYLISRYSSKGVYSLIDLSFPVLLFFISLFSIALYRLKTDRANEQYRWSLGTFISEMKWKDLSLLVILGLCAGIDYGVFRLTDFSDAHIAKQGFQWWVDSILFMLRVYCPLFLFAIVQYVLAEGKLRLSFRKITFLLLSLWFMYEFSFEALVYIRKIVLDLIMAPFDEQEQFYIESILAIPLIAFFFTGFHAAMVDAQRLMDTTPANP